ncbi:MAG: efflux RND transporter permease subunit [Planctomycetota bacterium]|nr:efflux RND transporter permease subunit [Planctomycetota bacterium]
MLDKIIAFSLRRRFLVALLALAIASLGLYTALALPVDVLPDLNRPTVTVMSEAHGLVPEDIERLVSRPIERAVSGAQGVVRVRSSSGMGLSVVYVEFDWDTDIYRNRQVVQERLQAARETLPAEVIPHLAPVSSLMGQILVIGVRSTDGSHDATALRSIVDQNIKLRLLSVPGVAQVVSSGGAPRQVQTIVDVTKLRAHDVTLEEVAHALRDANRNASGGFLPVGARGPLVSVTGLARTEQDLAQAVVREDPVRPILLQDVAEVRFGPAAIRIGDAGIDASAGVAVVVSKQPGIDTLDLTKRIDAEIELLRASMPEDVEIVNTIYRQSDFIERAVENVVDAVRDGAILVLIVLLIFLMNLRTTFITLTAIPLSIAVTTIAFYLMGISINTMTLGGLAVAIGALVDDAIVDVENVFRRLRQNEKATVKRSALAVVFSASSEVRKPILIGTAVVAAVYLPLFALPGMEGRLFTPIGVTYIVSIVASLLVALTVTPVLCYWLLPSIAAKQTEDGWLVKHLKNAAEWSIRFSMRHPVGIAASVGSLCVVGMLILGTTGSEFLPPFNEGSAQVNIVLPPGTSLDTSTGFGRRLERVVLDVDGVGHVGRRTGRAEGDEHAMDVNVTEMIVSFDPESTRSRAEVLHDIRDGISEEFPGVPSSTEQPLAHLLSHLLSGVTAQVAIKVEGPDLRVLRSVAANVKAKIEGIDGVTDLMVEPSVPTARIEVQPRRADLARHGLRVTDVAETVELALEGEEVSRLLLGEFSYPIIVRLRAEDRRDLGALEDLRVRGRDGRTLALADVADVKEGWTVNHVKRENQTRRLVVQHNVEGRSLGEVVGDVKTALEEVRAGLPPGYAIRVSGQFEAQEQATRIITLLSLVSLLIMFLVLYAHFRSVNLTIQVLLNIPAAFLGAVAMIILTDQTLSVATLVGLVALGGVASRNGILLIDHYLHLMREEGAGFSPEMIVRAGRERIVPVLMTALTSGVALVPLVLSPGEPGRELLYPVASAIVGGLLSSTLLDLFLTPGVFLIFGRKAAEAHLKQYDPERIAAAQEALAFDQPNPQE